jgi:hypothetical protein
MAVDTAVGVGRQASGGGWHGGGGHWNGGSWHGAGVGWHGGGGNWNGAVGELAPQSVSVLALDYSGERSQLLLIMAMTTAKITLRMPVHPRQRSGIGATPIRATTLTYPNARFGGSKLFSNL